MINVYVEIMFPLLIGCIIDRVAHGARVTLAVNILLVLKICNGRQLV